MESAAASVRLPSRLSDTSPVSLVTLALRVRLSATAPISKRSTSPPVFSTAWLTVIDPVDPIWMSSPVAETPLMATLVPPMVSEP